MTTAPPAETTPPQADPLPPALQQTPVIEPTTGPNGNAPQEDRPNRETRRAEAKKAKKAPTFDQMRAKKPREADVVVTLTDEDGMPEDYTMRIRALGSKAYDKLIAAHPPTNKQRDQQQTFNIDAFAPALISACLIDPKLTVEEVQELYESDEWAPGEIGNIYFSCQRLCNMGLDVPFNGAV